MNCRRWEQWLDEYVDETLPHAERAAADRHLAGCAGCRELLRRRREAGQALSRMFRQATDSLQLRTEVERRVLREAAADTATRRELSFSGWFARPVWRWAAVAGGLVAASLLVRHVGRPRQVGAEAALSWRGGPPATIHLSYSMPVRAFERDGAFVRDTLTEETVVVSGSH